jgi:DNA polymerase-3 subunit epsilon
MRQIFLDTETTGLSAENGDRIIEIGCIELVNRKLTGNNKRYYLNPGRESHEDALKVHGITREFLSDKPKFESIVTELLDYLRDAEIIIHNAPFDIGFLNKELELLGLPPLTECVARVMDTLVMAKSLYPGKRNSLDALCDRLGVDKSGRTQHGALLDAGLLAEVYINLTRGQDALLIEGVGEERTANSIVPLDLSGLALPVLVANDQELAAHEAILDQIEKERKLKSVWRSEVPNENMAQS